MNQKSLEKELKQKEIERNNKFEMQKSFQAECSKLDIEIKYLRDQIRVAKAIPSASDHSLLRYLERKLNLNIDGYKQEILKEVDWLQVKTVGRGKFPLSSGGFAVIENKKIITIHE